VSEAAAVHPSALDEPLLELRGLRAAYDKIEVLHGVNLAVPPGSVYAVLGPNGAGKTTMLNVLAGLLAITGGDVILAGRRVNGANPTELARRGVCSIPEGRGVFPNLTIRENLWMMTHAGVSRADVEDQAFARFPRLAERRNQQAGTLSGGEQQMLSVARAITTNPALLLLDELSMGLAPVIVEQLYEAIGRIANEGVTVLVVEQFARTVLGVADFAAVMVGGRVVHAGPPTDIATDLSAAYFGVSVDD
jgi:branched-chain amino acid transport system ATP-binding protein